MLTSFRGPRAAFLAAMGLVPFTPVFAQDHAEPVAPAVTVSGNLALVTDYRFRGVSLSGGDPAVQGGITLTHASGFYAGAWASSIDDGGSDVYGDMELDLFAGWSGAVGEGVTLDAGLLHYTYPTNAAGAHAAYLEPYVTISGTLGPVEAKAGINYAWEHLSLGGRDNLYLHTGLSAGIPQTPFTLTAHLGYTEGALAPPLLAGAADDTGFDWSLGVSATVLGAVTLGVSYTGVDGPAVGGLTDDAVVGSISVSF